MRDANLDWADREWHLCSFNSGWEIRYVGEDLESHPLPLELGDDGHGSNRLLLVYLVTLHNHSLRSAK